MKILNIGLDEKAVIPNSRVFGRITEYQRAVEKYELISVQKNLFKPLALLKVFWEAKRVLKKEKFDVLTVQDPYFVGIVGVLLSRFYKVGLEIQVHGFEKLNFLRRLIAGFVLWQADAIRVVSERLKKKITEEFRISERKITVAHIFLEASVFLPKLAKKPDEPFIFLSVGRLVPIKNFEMQFRAFVNFSRNNKKAELWIVGEGPEKNKLVTLAKDLGIAGQVRFFGWSDNISEFYAQADAFLLTSLAEGWPLVIAEAAAVSLPIIMTDVGSAGEFIKNGENGIVVPVNDVSALGEAMEKIIENTNLRNKLGEVARQSFLSLSSKEEILALYKKSWQLAINNNRK